MTRCEHLLLTTMKELLEAVDENNRLRRDFEIAQLTPRTGFLTPEQIANIERLSKACRDSRYRLADATRAAERVAAQLDPDLRVEG